jgi:hypothetical protein
MTPENATYGLMRFCIGYVTGMTDCWPGGTSDDHERGVPSDGTTVTEVIDGYRAAGFTADFGAEADGQVSCDTCATLSPASSIAVASLRRMEGASDPDDMLAVVAMTCPACGAQGTAVLGYGPSSSSADLDVLRQLNDNSDANSQLPSHATPDETATGTTT